MSEPSDPSLSHLPEPPAFAFDNGQPFKLAGDDDPDEYWYVMDRVWNYDARIADYGPPGWYYRQYVIGDVSSLGGNERLTTEQDLLDCMNQSQRQSLRRCSSDASDEH